MHLFHDVRFPLEVALGARGGPVRRTDALPLASGAEHRNAPHRHSRRRYDAGVGVKSLADIDTLLSFFEARAGRLHSFRFRDPLDHRARDQRLGTGDGERVRFALFKTYGDAAAGYDRPLRFAHAVVVTAPFQPYRMEDGAVVFDTPPAPGTPVVADFEFDTVVRFDTDRLDISVEDARAGQVPSLPLVEVLSHELEP